MSVIFIDVLFQFLQDYKSSGKQYLDSLFSDFVQFFLFMANFFTCFQTFPFLFKIIPIFFWFTSPSLSSWLSSFPLVF